MEQQPTQVKKELFIKQFKFKDEIETVFFVKFISLMEARDGRKYLNVILSDSTGELEARVWQNAETYHEKIARGAFVRAQGKLNVFQGRKQFIISDMTKLNEKEVNSEDFVFKAARPSDQMYKDLLGIVDRLDDVYIRELLQSILKDEEISRRLKLWPAGKTIHHAYQSGLLEHILSCSELAVNLSRKYDCNRNYVVAGAIIHDLCKIYELSSGLDTDYTEEGKLVGHLSKGVEIIDRFSYRIKGFPYQTKMHLKHIMLSHHGEFNYGSPKLPSTSEAMLLHLIDFMDSKMNAFETIKRTDLNSGDWSGYIKHLDRMVYKAPLPIFTSFQSREEKPKNDKKKPQARDLKQNLGKLLEGFKVEE